MPFFVEKCCRPPAGPAADGNGLGGFGGATPTPMPAPEEANAVLAWIQDWTPQREGIHKMIFID